MRKKTCIHPLLIISLCFLFVLACSVSSSKSKTYPSSDQPAAAQNEVPFSNGQPEQPVVSQAEDTSSKNDSCVWQLMETNPSTASTDHDIMSATSGDNSITTSYRTPASGNCNETVFQTTHSWIGIPDTMTPGDTIPFTVTTSWSLIGSRECVNIATGVTTWISAGATTIIARQEKVIPSTEPTGSISNSATFPVYRGKGEGDTLSIRAHGEQGGVGGTIIYKYTYVCGGSAKTATATPEPTPEPSACYPKISNIENLKPGDVLSPAVDFVNDKSALVGVIGHAWFINGSERSSVVWDGKEAHLELQYTCLDHSGHSKSVTIPAFTGGPTDTPEGGSDQQQLKTDASNLTAQGKLPPAASIAGLLIGLGGAGLAGGALVMIALNANKEAPIKTEKTTDQKSSRPHEKEKNDPGNKKDKEKEKPDQEKKKERKNMLDAEKEAIDKYQQTLEKISGSVGDAMDLIENMDALSPEGRKKLMGELSKFKESLDKVSETSGKLSGNLEKLQNIRDDLKMIGEKYKQIQKAHMEAFKELEDLPEGSAHQLADLTTAIEGFGTVADEVMKRIPYFNRIYSDEYFQTVDSFKQFSKGIRKNFSKTIFRSAVEGKKELTPKERIEFGEKGLENKPDPEIQRLIRERKALEAKQSKNSVWNKVNDFVFGKETPPDVKSFR